MSSYEWAGVSEGPWEWTIGNGSRCVVWTDSMGSVVACEAKHANAAFIAHARSALPEACRLLELMAQEFYTPHHLAAARAFLAAQREAAQKGGAQ